MDQQQTFRGLRGNEAQPISANLQSFYTDLSAPKFKALAEHLEFEVRHLSARAQPLDMAAEAGLLSSDPFAGGALLNAEASLDAQKLCNDATGPIEHLPNKKPAFLKGLTFYLDGISTEHKVKKVKGEFFATVLVPQANGSTPSHLKLSLPEVCSPAELDQGSNKRQLGIALMMITTRPATFTDRLCHRA